MVGLTPFAANRTPRARLRGSAHRDTRNMAHDGEGMPRIDVIAGPNRAGETTFAREFLPYHADCKQFINADLIAQGMSPFSPDAAAFRAGRLMLQEIERYAGLKESSGFETTFSGLGYLRLLPRFKNSGYEVHFFVSLGAHRFSRVDPSQRSSPSRGTQRAGDYRAKAIRAFHS
jgi:hypothetical protein